jgi:hypothetical protein
MLFGDVALRCVDLLSDTHHRDNVSVCALGEDCPARSSALPLVAKSLKWLRLSNRAFCRRSNNAMDTLNPKWT